MPSHADCTISVALIEIRVRKNLSCNLVVMVENVVKENNVANTFGKAQKTTKSNSNSDNSFSGCNTKVSTFRKLLEIKIIIHRQSWAGNTTLATI